MRRFNSPRNNTIIAACNFLILIVWIIYSLKKKGSFHFSEKAIDISDAIDIAIAVITTTIAFCGALLAYDSLRSTQRAEEGNLYLRMMERYSSKEMATALRLLGKFQVDNNLNLIDAIKKWKIDLSLKQEYAITLENARHKVKYFYRDLMQMNQANYLSDSLTKTILNAGGRLLFKNIVLLMEPHTNPHQFVGEYGKFAKFDADLKRELKPSFLNKKPLEKICLIPARYDASRYPGKLLSLLDDGINKKTVIRATYDRILSYNLFDYVAVVTNSIKIKDEIETFGGNVIFNNKDHSSGSDRIAEALEKLSADIIVNVQGDEPFVEKKPLSDLLQVLIGDLYINNEGSQKVLVSSLMRPMMDQNQIQSSDFVKVVCNKNNYALYFSRSVIPYKKNVLVKPNFYEHIGVYAFTRNALLQFSKLLPSNLEQIESVECLRYLENGISIKMVETEHLILEIDTEEDLIHANYLLKCGKLSLI